MFYKRNSYPVVELRCKIPAEFFWLLSVCQFTRKNVFLLPFSSQSYMRGLHLEFCGDLFMRAPRGESFIQTILASSR